MNHQKIGELVEKLLNATDDCDYVSIDIKHQKHGDDVGEVYVPPHFSVEAYFGDHEPKNLFISFSEKSLEEALAKTLKEAEENLK
jgi:hypothetical protein